ncbi:YecA family protein [Lysinibacillus sp. NPDC093712]|uniref:YecA family protein n=1 Tax=Lysinibacillus sp. NPDC093712 TaxID=3390579 RepID=UPI003D086D0C
MNIGRNDPCPCKSGIKYKKCHGNLKEKLTLLNPNIPIESAINQRMRDAKFKQCIHPEKEKCSNSIIKAHSIQNNRILTTLARNGMLYMIKGAPTAARYKLKFKEIGRKEATTFTGFCGYHDNMLFEPIEDKEYIGDEQQHFLFAYRAFSFEYHKKLEAQNAHKKIAFDKPSVLKDRDYLNKSENYELGVKDLLRHKDTFDSALLKNDFDVVETISFVLDGPAGLAVSSGFFLEYDISGHILNNLSLKNEIMRLLMFNIFPSEGNTIILFSWLKKDAEFYKRFRNQLLSLDNVKIIKLLNNLIPAYCENVVYNPDYIDNWDKIQKDEYLSIFQASFISVMGPIKRSLLQNTNYNLFDNITV